MQIPCNDSFPLHTNMDVKREINMCLFMSIYLYYLLILYNNNYNNNDNDDELLKTICEHKKRKSNN
jgi:hypothetical protein